MESTEKKALNVMCSICSEFYDTNDIIYSTTLCGHVFHKDCLIRWLCRSQTCPQCRASCHRKRIHRLYLNFGEHTPSDDVQLKKPAINWICLDLDEPDTVVPLEGAIKFGTDHEGNDTYVARVYFQNDLLPASYVPAKRAVRASFGWKAYMQNFGAELLVDCEHKWVPSENGEVPGGAIQTGYSYTGETLFTARAIHLGFNLLGKVHPSYKLMYMPFQELEVNSSKYEVLIHAPTDKTE